MTKRNKRVIASLAAKPYALKCIYICTIYYASKCGHSLFHCSRLQKYTAVHCLVQHGYYKHIYFMLFASTMHACMVPIHNDANET